jgi:hypothetical protein
MQSNSLEKHRDLTGAYLGAVTGGLFALSAWGVDLLVVALSHGVAAWAKFPPGLIASVLTGALAGFLTARSSKLPTIIAIWVGWGIAMSLLASLLPFDFQSAVISLVRPLLRQEIDYPLPDYHGRRMFLSILISCGLMFIVSILFSALVDSIAANVHIGSSILSIAGISVIFIGFGLSLDSVYNRPFRNAMDVTHQTIELARANPQALENGSQSNQLGLLGIRTIDQLLDRPYQIVVKSYNITLESMQVMIDFDGFWYECSVNDNTVYYCK